MNAATPRRQSKAEAAISDEMMAFQHGFVGRGPDRIRTRIVEDLVIVRSFGVFTAAEKHLADSHEGRRLIKAMRQQVLAAGRRVLEDIVKRHTGAEVVSVEAVRQAGIEVVSRRLTTTPLPDNLRYLRTKQARLGHDLALELDRIEVL